MPARRKPGSRKARVKKQLKRTARSVGSKARSAGKSVARGAKAARGRASAAFTSVRNRFRKGADEEE